MQYGDMRHDTGIYDMFLHAQDRAFTILEVHEWLERCGMEMTSEPGIYNMQRHYDPEFFVKDKALLKSIKQKPLREQQAIAEAMSNRHQMHHFLAIRKGQEHRVASVHDKNLIPYCGSALKLPFVKLAEAAESQGKEFVANFGDQKGALEVTIPHGRCVPAILRLIDGKRSVKEIIAEVAKDPAFKKRPPSPDTIMDDFERLFMSINRVHLLFLRDKSVDAYPMIGTYNERVKALYPEAQADDKKDSAA